MQAQVRFSGTLCSFYMYTLLLNDSRKNVFYLRRVSRRVALIINTATAVEQKTKVTETHLIHFFFFL